MEVENIPLSEIVPYENNPRKNDKAVDVVAKSIKEFGFNVPILLDKANRIIAGHTRAKAAIKLGLNEVPVIWLENLNEEQVKAFRIMDNKTQEYARWDEGLLKTEFFDLKEKGFDLDLTGFSETELGKIMGNDSKEVPVPEGVKYDIHIEDFYELDNGKGLKHYVYCGDATNKEDVDKLLQGNKIDMVFTDPPYNLGYEYNTYKDDKTPEEYEAICSKWFDILKQNKKIIITPGKQNLMMWAKISKWKDIAVWIKRNAMSGGKISHLSIWEPILFFGDFDRKSRPTDVFEINLWHQKDVNKDHTCPKPITLVTELLKTYSKKEETILDVFGGSGTTLIACEQTGRNCYMMELDEDYCSKIIERWENLTGKKAKKISKDE